MRNVKRPSPRTRSAAGFTLVELMVSLAVLGVLMAIAVPSFANLIASSRLTTQASELVASLNLARSEAVRRAQPVTLRASDADNFALGWKVFPDADADGAPAGTPSDTDGNPLRQTAAFKGTPTSKRVTRSGTAPSYSYANSTDSGRIALTFNARGAITTATAVFFRVCDPSNTAVKGRIVQVNVVGKVALDSVAATCP